MQKVSLAAKIVSLVSLSILLPLTGAKVLAQSDQANGQAISLQRGEVVDKDYFASSGQVTLSGTVNGDAYVAGGNILVDGVVNGDLLVGGGNVNVTGTVANNIRVAGGNVTISAKVGKNVTAVGGSVEISNSADISGSLVVAGGNIQVLGPVGKEMNLAAGQATLGSSVGSGVYAAVSQLTLSPGAKINGDLTYVSRNRANISPEASVSGKVTQNLPPPQPTVPPGGLVAFFSGLFIWFKVVSFIAALIVGALVLLLFPNFTQETAGTLREKPWLSLGIGFLAMIVTPAVVVLLLLTVIGIPLGLIFLAVYLIGLYLAKIFVAVVVGGLIMQALGNKDRWYLALILGLLIYYLLTLIPVAGWIVSLVVFAVGLGALAVSTRDFYRQLSSKKAV